MTQLSVFCRTQAACTPVPVMPGTSIRSILLTSHSNSPVVGVGDGASTPIKGTQVGGPGWRRRRRPGLVLSIFVVKHFHSAGESNAFVVAMPWGSSQLGALWAYQGRWRDRGSEPRRSVGEDRAFDARTVSSTPVCRVIPSDMGYHDLVSSSIACATRVLGWIADNLFRVGKGSFGPSTVLSSPGRE